MTDEELQQKIDKCKDYIGDPWNAENLKLMEEVLPCYVNIIQRPVEDNDVLRLIYRMGNIMGYAALIENFVNSTAEIVQKDPSAVSRYPVSQAVQYIHEAMNCLHPVLTSDCPDIWKLSQKKVSDINIFEISRLFILMKQDLCMESLFAAMVSQEWLRPEGSHRFDIDEGYRLIESAKEHASEWADKVSEMTTEDAEGLVKNCSSLINDTKTTTLEEIQDKVLPLTFWLPEGLRSHLDSYIGRELELRKKVYHRIADGSFLRILVEGFFKICIAVILYGGLYIFVHSDMLTYVLLNYVHDLKGSLEMNIKLSQYIYYALLVFYGLRTYQRYSMLKNTQKAEEGTGFLKLLLGALPIC